MHPHHPNELQFDSTTSQRNKSQKGRIGWGHFVCLFSSNIFCYFGRYKWEAKWSSMNGHRTVGCRRNVSHPGDELFSYPFHPFVCVAIGRVKTNLINYTYNCVNTRSDDEMKRVCNCCNWNDTIQARMKGYHTVAHSWNAIVTRAPHARIFIVNTSCVVSLFTDAVLHLGSTHTCLQVNFALN